MRSFLRPHEKTETSVLPDVLALFKGKDQSWSESELKLIEAHALRA